MKIGICLSSRGMMFSKTTESIFNNIKGFENCELYMAHGLPIPICFNYTIKRALDSGCDYIWLVEEDMDIPEGTLKRMLQLQKPIVTCNYADRRSGCQLISRSGGKVLFSGMGCLLIKREVLEKVEAPWCRTGVFWKVWNEDETVFDWEYQPDITFREYGSQDVYLCTAMRKAGYEITELENANIGHMKLIEKAEDVKNNGGDNIETIYLKLDAPLSEPNNGL